MKQYLPATQMGKRNQSVARSSYGGSWLRFLLWTICMMLPCVVWAKAGTHGRAVSSWDTTRSTVVFDYRHGFLLGGGFTNTIGYNANFTSTTGKLSSQFGLQYMNLAPDAVDSTLHGAVVSVIALYAFPFGKRYSNGLPKAAFSIYGGVVPTAIFNGEHNYVTFPFTLGLGLEINPIRQISIIPWVEGAPSANLDTIIRYDEFQNRLSEGSIDDVKIEYGPNGEVVDVQVDNAVVDEILEDVVDLEFSVSFRLRAGLSFVLNLGDRVDLQINGSIAQIGNDFSAKPTVFIGSALVFAWDDPPLAILPEEERTKSLSCKSVQSKYVTCGEYKALIKRIRKEEANKLKAKLKNKIVVHEQTPIKDAQSAQPTKEILPKSSTEAKTPGESAPVVPVDSELKGVTPASSPSTSTPTTPAPVAPVPKKSTPAVSPPTTDRKAAKPKLPSLSDPIQ